ncbi:MAG TPA: SAM-dependent methyltransferase [Candidatus Lumbricidophila sp.]|nr:SAM-dependent methyltransferase [Candidatus Lumbricidophila sp.]
MDPAELALLRSPEGVQLLESMPRFDPADDALRRVTSLRQHGHPAELVSAVLTQSRLRAKARAKFGEASDRMLFTQAGLEQATRLPVARVHAQRFVDAGCRVVADLGCGIGGDALALAQAGLQVLAVDADETTAAIAAHNLAPFAAATAQHGTAENASLDGVDGVFLDPARRTTSGGVTHRRSDAAEYTPSLDFAFGLAAERPVGVKLGPGTDRDVIPAGAEAQWISVDGDVVELGVWVGAVARPGVGRAALLLHGGQTHELTAPADSPDAEVGPLGEYLHEPDGSVIRARLIGDLVRQHGGAMVSDGIAYFSTGHPIASPFASSFRVIDELPTDERRLRQALQTRGIGVLEIKKRGVDVDPAKLRSRLRLKGDVAATIVLTRIGGRHTTLLVERVT